MKKVDKWVKNNCGSFKNKNVVVLGATGSLGKEICDILLSSGANLFLSVRNLSKAEKLKEELLDKNYDSKIEVLHIDLSSSKSTKEYALNLKKIRVDYFIDCAGVYHLNQKIVENDLEIHFATNYYNQILLLEEIEDHINNCNGKIVVLGSISQRFYKLNYNDIMSLKTKNKTKVYARSKLMFVLHTLYKNKNGSNIVIAHPGISPTTLFSSEKGNFSKIFDKIIYPLMKLIFISPRVAALNIIYALTNDIEYGYQVGPRGLFHIWGYPKKYKFNKSVLKEKNQLKIVGVYNKIQRGEKI